MGHVTDIVSACFLFMLFAVGLGLLVNGVEIFQDHEPNEEEEIQVLIPSADVQVIATTHPAGTGPSTTIEEETIIAQDPVSFLEMALEECIAECFSDATVTGELPVFETREETTGEEFIEYVYEYNEELFEALGYTYENAEGEVLSIRECEVECAHDYLGEEEEEEEEEEQNPGTPWILSGVLLIVFPVSAIFAFCGWFAVAKFKESNMDSTSMDDDQ
eukprot:TRINITY_DN3343_c0_g1_i1.p1 TRINITY_DN3343_c0_g1~~TRINITY_DN3343_c0_g1_i1.p1  ORF type:complete len:218 (-),score=43.99 TRINITY_DN3343_c0_g1_i1:55-708(-)